MNKSLNNGLLQRKKIPLLKKALFIMRCMLLFVLLGTLQSFAAISYSQATMITLAKEDASIKEILALIEEESEFYFTYNLNQIDVNKKTTIDVQDMDIAEILDQLFSGDDVKYTISDRHIVLYKEASHAATETKAEIAHSLERTEIARRNEPSSLVEAKRTTAIATQAQQQTRTISGTVIDHLGEPLIGVNIRIKENTSLGTITNTDGQFNLPNVPQGSTLVISYVGYITQEIAIGSSSTFTITMREDAQSLDELVVVGYGVQKKQSLTGAITSISSEQIETTKTDNLITNLQGKMPGLLIRQKSGEPGDYGAQISIRGFGEPLIVIDGVARDGAEQMAQMNPDDIESISILKDASAAIYGMNAANGVLMITTKRGQSGKARFAYQGMFGMQIPTGMETTVDAYTYRLMANEMRRNGGDPDEYGQEILDMYKNNEPGYTDTDWIDLYMRDYASRTSHTMSVRGGSNNVRYSVSFGYNDTGGLLASNIQYDKRYNLRTNLTADITKDLELFVGISGTYTKTQTPREDFIWTYKTLQINDRGVGPYAIGSDDKHYSYIQPEGKNPASLVDPNGDGYRRYKRYRFSSDVKLIYTTPFDRNLKFSVQAAFDPAILNRSMLRRATDLYNYYTDTYVSTYEYFGYENEFRMDTRLFMNGMVSWAKTWNRAHNFSTTGVVEMTYNRADQLQGTRQYSDIFTSDIINQGTSTTASNEGFREFRKTAAYFGRVNYDYMGKYLFEATGRYDGSYVFSPNSRWGFFPSVSLAWRISEESFLKNALPFVSNLKLRASIGETGWARGVDAFQYIAGYSSSNGRGYVFNDGELTVGMTPPGVVNDKMSWQTNRISNIGLDFDLWNGKFGGVVEYFERKTTGILATPSRDIPNIFGASIAEENLNSNINKGIELELYHRGQIGGDLSYIVSGNVTFVRRKILYREGRTYSSQWQKWTASQNNSDYRYDGRMGLYHYDGQYQSLIEYETAPLLGGTMGNSRMLPGSYRLIDRNNDGRITSADQYYNHWTFGSGVNPPLQFGLNLNLSYKSFDLNALFQGAALFSINHRNNDIWGYGRYPTLHKKYLDRWRPTNATDDPYDPNTQWTSGFYPALRKSFANTTDENAIDIWRIPATYLRLKTLEVGYNLPRNFIRNLGLSNVRVFASGTNLFTLCRKELREIDPEKNENSWDAGLSYPIMKDLLLGININF